MKTIHSEPEFHGLMKKVAEKLKTQVCKVKDAEKEVEIAGCVEVKGIRGTDKRCYIVDLQGMQPRDANYLGDENHTCLVRQELILLYHRHQQVEHARIKLKEAEKELEDERTAKIKEIGIEEGKEATPE